MSLVVEASALCTQPSPQPALNSAAEIFPSLSVSPSDRFDSIPAQPCSLEPASPAVPTTSKNKKNQDDNDQKRRVVHFVLLR
jgi:hypothetical protein